MSAEDANATPTQLLDRALSRPGVRGVIDGLVLNGGRGRTVPADPGSGVQLDVVTDYAVRVAATYGATGLSLPAGTVVKVRVDGGSAGGINETVEDAPRLHKGERVMIFAQDWKPPTNDVTSTPLHLRWRGSLATVEAGRVNWDGDTFRWLSSCVILLHIRYRRQMVRRPDSARRQAL